MTDSMTPILTRLEEGGSRELDAEIVALLNKATVRLYPPSDDFGPRAKWQFWSLDGAHFLGNESKFPVEPVTTSVDAALALAERVLPGCDPGVCLEQRLETGRTIWAGWVDLNPGTSQFAATPAAALCLAILKAQALSDQGRGENG